MSSHESPLLDKVKLIAVINHARLGRRWRYDTCMLLDSANAILLEY